ncbi:MAG: hypothetical protein ABI634_20300, partial [Acidobacteriota bacterium]
PTSVFWQLFRRGGQPVHMTAAVTDERNQVIVRTEGVLDVGEKGAALVTTHRLKLPTSRMAPGRYQLQLTATDGRTIDRRGVAFEVR